MISVLILTYNEEKNLPACLSAVSWSDDIVVFDSFSTDKTVEIARAAGARVIQRVFDNERDHRAASLKISFKHPWVFNPDADEIPSKHLVDEMRAIALDQSRGEVAYRVRFRTIFLGKWIKRSSLYPTWVVRFFRPAYIQLQREINLAYVISGPEGRLSGHFDHFTFNNGLTAWFEKHNRYSEKEARETLLSLSKPMAWRGLVGTAVERRRALKELSFRIPCRPLARFLYMYVWRLGLLDGVAGYHYCRLLSIYEYMIVLKASELASASRVAADPGDR